MIVDTIVEVAMQQGLAGMAGGGRGKWGAALAHYEEWQ